MYTYIFHIQKYRLKVIKSAEVFTFRKLSVKCLISGRLRENSVPKTTSEHVLKVRRSDLSSCTTIYCLRYLSTDTVCPRCILYFAKRDRIERRAWNRRSTYVHIRVFRRWREKVLFVTLYTYTYENTSKQTEYHTENRDTQKIHYTLFRVLFVLIMKF